MTKRSSWNKRHDPPGMRWCPRCKALVAHEDYTKSKRGPGGFGGSCKPCKAVSAKAQSAKQAGKPDLTAAARFWPKVNKHAPNGCWLWTGATGKDRYGRFVYQGTVRHAHRVAMILSGYDVPADMDVDHCVCRDRACCNPAHLRVATERQNALENNESPLARNARKTHCKYGHSLSGSNVRVVKTKGPRGSPCTGRVCLKCYGPGGIRRGKRAQQPEGT